MTNITPRLRAIGLRLAFAAALPLLLVVAVSLLRAADVPPAKTAAPAQRPLPRRPRQGEGRPGIARRDERGRLDRPDARAEVARGLGDERELVRLRLDEGRRMPPRRPEVPAQPDARKQVVDMAKAGKSKDEIVKAALTPPTKFVQFPLEAGKSPSVGRRTRGHDPPLLRLSVPVLHAHRPDARRDRLDLSEGRPRRLQDAPAGDAPERDARGRSRDGRRAQGKFFEMDKKLFENQQNLTR